MEQAIIINDDVITINGHLFVHKDYSITNKELLIDLLSVYYDFHKIKIVFWDGENIEFSGFDNFIKYICDCFSIPLEKITFETHSPQVHGFKSNQMKLGIFLSTGRCLDDNFVHEYQNKKFVGALLGRANPTRLRLAYEIDQVFPTNNFIVFQPKVEQVKRNYALVKNIYEEELNWLENKQFDKDLTSSHPSGMIEWQDSNANYTNICNQYQIEVISETDALSNYWFTEKTARCLALGKPFVLIAGKGSLSKLRTLGFETFGDIINNFYDDASTPTYRIDKALIVLQDIFNSSQREQLINELYQLAAKNKEIYKEFTNK